MPNRGHQAHAAKIMKEQWVKTNKRIFNNAKVSDHFAIIPTLQMPKELSEAESKIYDLVVKRFMAVFFPAAEYRVTTRITKVEAHHFKTEGKVLVYPGWLEIYGREAQGQKLIWYPLLRVKKSTPKMFVLRPWQPNRLLVTLRPPY
ncbi:DNA topoisomerase III [Oligella ureolytica]